MKERPINYTAAMVLARHEGRKKQTRRVAGFFCGSDAQIAAQFDPRLEDGWWKAAREGFQCKCPYGVPFDRLWVREAYTIEKHVEELGVIRLLGRYEADRATFDIHLTRAESEKFIARQHKTGASPARFMYRSLSRGLDEVVNVRVERVQEITGADVFAEGFERRIGWKLPDLETWYRTLWDSINASRKGCAWVDNPWVWVIEFRPIKPVSTSIP